MNSNFKKFLYFYLFSLSNIGFLPLVRDLEVLKRSLEDFHDLETIKPTTDMRDVEEVLVKHCSVMISAMETMKNNTSDPDKICELLIRLNTMMEKAWQVPAFGNEIGKSLSRILQSNGGLDMLIDNCDNSSNIRLQVRIFEFCCCVFTEFFQKYLFVFVYLQFLSAKLLQQCLVPTENRGYVVEKGLDKVINVAKKYTENTANIQHNQVGTGILEQLFRHSEVTCRY